MSDELLTYYSQELSYIRKMAAEFANRHKEAAERLLIGSDGDSQDPHVDRMVQAFAYLTARIRRKLDDDFSQVSEGLLGMLYPHYLSPIPSAAIMQMTLDREQGGLFSGYMVEAETQVTTDPIKEKVDPLYGEFCTFRTCYKTTLWPIEVESASLSPGLPQGMSAETASDAKATLNVRLKCFNADATVAQMQMPALRFYLHGAARHSRALYELLLRDTVKISLSNPRGANLRWVDREALVPVGFERGQEMLPQDARTFPGYRLLSEFFALPEKFLFVEIGLDEKLLSGLGGAVDLNFYLKRSTPELEHNISAKTFCLGCTPIINLFSGIAEPIELTGTQTEYRIVPKTNEAMSREVHSVQRVTATSPTARPTDYKPLYSHRHGEEGQAFWFTTRKAAEESEADTDQTDRGTEVYISLVDLDHQTPVQDQQTLTIHATYMNRDLAHRFPYARMHMEGGKPMRLECLTPPTPTLRPPLGGGTLWRLISHLSLNHLSIRGDHDSAKALQEILNLYNPTNSGGWAEKIAAILSVKAVGAARPIADAVGGGFCRGFEVKVQLDEEKFPNNDLYLFASVLERFLAMYATINSFSQLTVTTTRPEKPPIRWRARASEKVLL